METSTKKINLDTSDVLLLLGVSIELHPVLRAFNYEIRDGIIFFAAANEGNNQVLMQLEACGINVRKFTKPSEAENAHSEILLKQLKTYDEPMKVLRFLDVEKRFIPALEVQDILPDFLQNGQNLFPLDEINFSKECTKKLCLELKNYIAYARENPDEICNLLRKLAKSKGDSGKTMSDSSLINSLKVSLILYSEYYRRTHSSADTQILAETLKRKIEVFEKIIDTYTNSCDVLGVVKKLLKQYMAEHIDIPVSNVNKIDGITFNALQNNRAVLYDQHSYFIPESLLKTVCEPIRNTKSFVSIKRDLHKNGILIANLTVGQGYTSKKVIACTYGFTDRPRFLEIKREFLVEPYELNIEERGVK